MPTELVLKLSKHEPVEDAIFLKVHRKQNMLAKEAPICSGKLFQDFGCVANTLALKAALDEPFLLPLDSDTPAKELFSKIAAIRRIIPKDSISPIITPAQ